jgi:hypothetical protein
LTWQRAFALLVCAFLPGAHVYWRLVLKFHEARYVIPAICFHIQYILTFVIVSLPLIHRWHKWNEHRTEAVAELAQRAVGDPRDDNTARLNAFTAALEKVQVAPRHAAVVAVIVTAASLLAPFFHAFFH